LYIADLEKLVRAKDTEINNYKTILSYMQLSLESREKLIKDYTDESFALKDQLKVQEKLIQRIKSENEKFKQKLKEFHLNEGFSDFDSVIKPDSANPLDKFQTSEGAPDRTELPSPIKKSIRATEEKKNEEDRPSKTVVEKGIFCI
jgi:chromosome segregation ATPase